MGRGKFYWLKLDKDFFKRHDIKIIESMPNGKDYILFYLKLLCESLDHDGSLRFNDQIPYNEDMLATITNTNPDTVRSAIKVFSELKMIEILDDGTYFMNAVNKMIGSETKWAEYKRNQRFATDVVNRSIEQNEVLKIGQCPTDVQQESKNCPIEIEKEIEKEKEIDIDSARVRLGIYHNVQLTKGELNELMRIYPNDYQDMIENLSVYMRSKGKYYEDHYATMMAWKRRDEAKAKEEKKPGNYWDEFDKLKEEYHDES